MFVFCIQYICSTTIFQYFIFSIYDFLILRNLVIFCNNSINVYCWQIHACVFSAFLRRLLNDDHCYYDLFFIFWWLYSELLMFFKRISVRGARWYYDHHFIFKFFFFFSSSSWLNDIVVFRLFENVLLTIGLCIAKSLIVNDIISFSAVRKHVFYAIVNYKNDLTDFSYNS